MDMNLGANKLFPPYKIF